MTVDAIVDGGEVIDERNESNNRGCLIDALTA